jgi:hypothetical protein
MTGPVIVPGQTAFRSYYLGTPGAMLLLRTPDHAYEDPASRAEVVHELISGGTAVTRRGRTRRRWTLGFTNTTPDTADQLVGFYAGVFGDGPFRFVDPSWRNALGVDASTFGARLDAISVWAASVSAHPLTFDTTVAAPSPQSGVMRWTGAQVNEQVSIGAWDGSKFVPSLVESPPYLPQVLTSIRVFARALSGAPSVSLRGRTQAADGATVDTQTATATLGTGAWTTLTATVPAGLAGAYVVPNLLCNTASSVLQFSCPLVQYGEVPPDPWVVGLGIPRVVFADALGARSNLLYARDHAMLLVEV